MTEDEMVGWHHQLYGHEFEQAPGVGDGQENLQNEAEQRLTEFCQEDTLVIGNTLLQ